MADLASRGVAARGAPSRDDLGRNEPGFRDGLRRAIGERADQILDRIGPRRQGLSAVSTA